MISMNNLAGFSLVALGIALTPGPNMMYVVSRSICQGPRAGLVSVAGVGVAFLIYMLGAAFGISALLLAVPYAYDALRFGGAAYLLFLAWQTLKPGGRSPFQVKTLPSASTGRLFVMGFFTNLLNPKIAMLYLSLLPQFIDPRDGSVLAQAIILGTVQICLSLAVNASMAGAAGSVAAFLNRRPLWISIQRWVMGTVLGGLALRLALDSRK